MFYRNGPDNINLERAALDMRELTCLTMEGLPGEYTFFFQQGSSGMYFHDYHGQIQRGDRGSGPSPLENHKCHSCP